MLQPNQINDFFRSKTGRDATPDEQKQYSNASFDTISKISPFVPAGTSQNAQQPPVNVSNATLPTGAQQPQPQAPQAPNNPQPETPVAVNQYDQKLNDSQAAYTTAQEHVASIDKVLNDSFINKKKEIEAQGGVVNETQLRAQIANEQAPLLSQRKSLAQSQATAGQQLSSTRTLHNQEANRLNQRQQFNQKQDQQLSEFNSRQGQPEKMQQEKFQNQKDLLTLKNQIASPTRDLQIKIKELQVKATNQRIESGKTAEANRIIGSQILHDKNIQNFQQVSPVMARVQSAQEDIAANGANPANMQEILDAVTQLNSGGKVITEGQIGLVKDSQSYQAQLATLVQKTDGEGGAISIETANQAVDLANKTFKIYEDQYKKATQKYQDRLKNVNGQDLRDYSPLTDISSLSDSIQGNTQNNSNTSSNTSTGSSNSDNNYAEQW